MLLRLAKEVRFLMVWSIWRKIKLPSGRRRTACSHWYVISQSTAARVADFSQITMEDLQIVETIIRKDAKVIEQCGIIGIPKEDMHKVYCDRKFQFPS